MSRLSFEAFELDLASGELRKGRTLIKLQPQPFKVLALLASRAGELVPREEIQKQVWTDDTFVDFDQGLNYCIRQIRSALCDDAETPRFIETVPRRGYRFLSIVEELAPPPARTVAGRVMLAVLPFENLSGDEAQEYFSDGLTDEMIAQLGRLNPQRLGVIARTSAMKYKHTNKSVDVIGRELGVAYILEGGVRRGANRVRVTAQLIQVSDQTHLWAQSYDRTIGDILALQSDLAHAIAGEIRVQLTPAERGRLAKLQPVDPAAYESYLKGHHFWNRRTRESLEKSVQCFQKAIEIDPGYVAAYAGLADVHLTQLDSNYLPPRDAFALANRVILDALRLDDTLAEPHTSLGHLRLHQFDWAAAERQFTHAIELNPGYGTAHYYYGNLLAALGRFDAAIGEADLARELDPISLNARHNRLFILYVARRYDEAIEQVYETIEIDPTYLSLYYDLGRIYAAQGKYDEAVAALQRVGGNPSRGSTVLAALGRTYALAGKRDQALKVLEQLDELSSHEYVSTYELALLCLALGDIHRGFALLSKAYDEHSSFLPFVTVDARLDDVRADPRFKELVRRMNFPSRANEPAPPRSSAAAAAKLTRSLAVLPFTSLSPGAGDDADYLGLGMTDALITRLGNIRQLIVRPTSAVRKYAGARPDAATAGRELAVDAVLEGSVQRAGERVRVSVQLINPQAAAPIWGDRFDEKFTDLFSLEDSISERIAGALIANLSGEERRRLTQRYTNDPVAYESYLKGRFHWNRRSEEDLKKAIAHFEQAVSQDPGYALAYSGLADCYTLLGSAGYETEPPREAMAKARTAAMKALEIDENVAEAQTSLALVRFRMDWNWAGAERAFRHAMELNAGYASAPHFLSLLLSALGRTDEAVASARQARELDPLSLIIGTAVGRVHHFARQYDRAIEACRKTLEMDPAFAGARLDLGLAYLQKSMFSEALGELRQAFTLSGGRSIALAVLAYASAVAGERATALKMLDQLHERARRHDVSPLHAAYVHVGLAHFDEAFRLMERAYQERAGLFVFLNVEPIFDPLRSDPRFADLVRRLQFPG